MSRAIRSVCHQAQVGRMTRGFTLIEVLIATLVTLMIVGSLTVMFGSLSDQVSDSRAVTALQDSLRHTKEVLINDLRGTTAPTSPPLDPAAELGYFEGIEGPIGPVFYPATKSGAQDESTFPLNDTKLPVILNSLPSSGGVYFADDTTLGDCDDILMFTTRSLTAPFTGSGFPDSQLISDHAEVIWFLRGKTLYRRLLLVRPSSPGSPVGYAASPTSLRSADFRTPDAGYDPAPQSRPATSIAFHSVGNSLGDLTKRENRFCHQPLVFPHDSRFFMRVAAITSNGSFANGAATGVNFPWAIARPGFMMPTLAETQAGESPTGPTWPWPINWSRGTARGIPPGDTISYRHLKVVNDYGKHPDGEFAKSPPVGGAVDTQLVIPGQDGIYPPNIVRGRELGDNFYFPIRVDARNGARRVFDPWSRRPLELNEFDYFGTDSRFASSFAFANYDKVLATSSAPGEEKRNIHRGGAGIIDAEMIRSYGTTPRFDDVIMTNVLSFDVKYWDPGAPIFTLRRDAASKGPQPKDATDLTVQPHDPAYKQALYNFIRNPDSPGAQPTNFGAFVDLNYMWGASQNSKLRKVTTSSGGASPPGYLDALESLEAPNGSRPRFSLPRPAFGGPGVSVSGGGNFFQMTNWLPYRVAPDIRVLPYPKGSELTGALHETWDDSSVTNTCRRLNQSGLASVYCTFSTHYENNGIDDDRDGIIDNYTNGVDDPGSDPGPDDPTERETVPPYPSPLRGVQIKIRAFEPDTRQIREVTITHEFILE